MPKWMKVLVGVLAILILAVVIGRIPKSQKPGHVPGVPEGIMGLEVSHKDLKVVLRKEDGLWRVKEPVDFPGDENNIKNYIESLKKLSVGESVTQRPESHAKYEVTDEAGTTVKLTGSGTDNTITWVFGKSAPDRNHLYVRIPNKPDVHLASGIKFYELKKPLPQWRDRRVLKIEDADSIVEVDVQRQKEAFHMKKDSATWTVNGKLGDAEKTVSFISKMRAFSAGDFIDPPENENLKALGLDKPEQKVVVTLASGKKIELLFGKKDESERSPVQRIGEPILFWIPSWRAKEIPEKVGDLLPSSESTK